MAQKQPSSTGNAQPKRQGGRGKRVRVEPTRRKRVDPDMIALCYWLIAQRIVEEAGDEGDAAEQPSPATASNDDKAPDRAVTGTES